MEIIKCGLELFLILIVSTVMAFLLIGWVLIILWCIGEVFL